MAASERSIKTLWAKRWGAIELCVSLLVVVYCIPLMFLRGLWISDTIAARVAMPGLQRGWLANRSIDLSDYQWREFRKNMGLLGAVFAGFAFLSRAVQVLAPTHRLSYYLLFSLVFIGVLHASTSIYVLGLICFNYAIAKAVAGRRYGLIIIWCWNCGTLLLARLWEGFPFSAISPELAFLDNNRGLLRWHIHYNLLILRCISFASDLHWARTGRPPRTSLPAGTLPSPDLTLKARTELALPLPNYSLSAYLAYCLYPPLYIAGPSMTFNQFGSQLAAPSPTRTRALALYAVRFLIGLLCLEVAQHTLYFNAIATRRLWQLPKALGPGGPTAFDVSLVGFWVIVFVWLKYLVMWRFFRLWSLADGVECPENMTRCVCNNYDVEGFWKNWHASYNLWLVRYVYIPLGGARWRAANVWAIFTFVALWHDLELRMLAWAWLFAAFVALEMAVKWLGRRPWFMPRKGWAFREVCAVAGTANIILLMSANLVGFVVGLDGVTPLLHQVFGDMNFSVSMLAAILCAVHLMFAQREWEASQTKVAHNGSTMPSQASRPHDS